ncbi:hypothetical protein GCM10010170_033780 [Dactylosporangium salmoneum]|uniref:Uncharacterized protein n=1 Tax=Dactylosporangium salmoneum TaxID=53361 RepID=A0ABN3G918_9ACTN
MTGGTSTGRDTSFEAPAAVSGSTNGPGAYPSDPPVDSRALSGAGGGQRLRVEGGDEDASFGGWSSGACAGSVDGWTDEQLVDGLRRVFAAIDGYPPKPAVHPSHQPEESGAELLPGHTTCKVCCRFVAHHGCASPRGVAPCAGPGRIELREEGR